MTDSQIVNLKLAICILNTALGLFALAAHAELFGKAIIGMLIAGLGPIGWNQWLHKEIFSTNSGKPYITHRSFALIGLLGALGVLLVVLHAIVNPD